jgi:putative Holliday junction resolvase
MKTFLGLDLGSKTLGIAISESGIIASAVGTFRFTEHHYEKAADEVIRLIAAHKVSVVVLGFPKHMNNDVGIRGQISESFKSMLEARSTTEIVLWDERLSTKTALKTMIKGDMRRSSQKDKKDELAAVVILQNYLDYKGASLC